MPHDLLHEATDKISNDILSSPPLGFTKPRKHKDQKTFASIGVEPLTF